MHLLVLHIWMKFLLLFLCTQTLSMVMSFSDSTITSCLCQQHEVHSVTWEVLMVESKKLQKLQSKCEPKWRKTGGVITAHTLWKINKSMIIKIYKNWHAFPHSYRAMYRYNWHFSLTYQQLCELRIKSCWNALKLVGWNTWQSFYSPSQTRWTTWNYLWGCTNSFFLSNSQWVIQYWCQLVCCKENNNVLSEDLLTVCSIHGDRSQHWIKSTFRHVHKIAESDY